MALLACTFPFPSARALSIVFPRYARVQMQPNSPFTTLRSTAPAMLMGLRRGKHAPTRVRVSMTAVIPEQYEHMVVESKWQKYWDDHGTFVTTRRDGKPKKYVLDMFPYPSGAGLHVGHPEGYTATDVMARFWRMQDFDVLHPMGWDAFGLPAEQHAINTGTHPAVTTYKNIKTFKRQLKSLGFSYDWTRELSTTDEEYVRWTQWIFLQLFKMGLAEQSEVSVNWCPALGTVLANEEVIDGKSERGSHPVTRVPLRQWLLKITHYADRLERDLEGLQWPEGTMSAQKAWIGRSDGCEIRFRIADSDEAITVFTTRPDTLMGVTYIVVAPESPLLQKIVTNGHRQQVDEYVSVTSGKSDMERTATGKDKAKTGTNTGAFAIHPLSGERVPVWTADYVLSGYGTGAVMAVPAHDERDFAFAEKFGLPVKRVVAAPDGMPNELPFTGNGYTINSGVLDGLPTHECAQAVVSKLTSMDLGSAKTTYKLRDWVFSRQRYWGEPIPIYFPIELKDPNGDPRRGAAHIIQYDLPIAVEESELPLKLPPMDRFEPGDDPQGALARAIDWRYFQKDGRWYARETNTMPQWAGSCWYYLRFIDNTNLEQPWSKQAARDWLPVDLYVGGSEHAVLHLLYARFWHKVLFDLGYVEHKEPFIKLVHQGMILGMDGEKMSKSRGNVINPDDVINEHGADALRLYEMFMGPLEAVKPWQTSQLTGNGVMKGNMDASTLRLMHKTIKKVTADFEGMAFNTAISTLMVFSNHLTTLEMAPTEAVETLVLLLSPLAPHLAEECWHRLGHTQSLAYVSWPTFQEELTIDDVVTLAVQINGKVRGTMELSVSSTQEQAQEQAFGLEGVQRRIEGKTVKKLIYVPGKILNIIV